MAWAMMVVLVDDDIQIKISIVGATMSLRPTSSSQLGFPRAQSFILLEQDMPVKSNEVMQKARTRSRFLL